MSTANLRTIIVAGNGLTKEAEATAVIKPGMLVERTGDAKVAPHSTAGGAGVALFAVEDDHQGKTIADDYASGDRVILEASVKGEEINAISEGAIATGDLVASAGNGKFAKAVADQTVLGVAVTATSATDERFILEVI